MRFTLFAIAVFCAAPVSAQQLWSNQYLANKGGSRLIQVESGEHQAVQASQLNAAGEMLIMSCSERYGERITSLGITKDGHPHWGQTLELAVKFSSGNEIDIGELRYAGGRYAGAIPEQIVMHLMTEPALILIDDQNGFSADFSMGGAANAIRNIECF